MSAVTAREVLGLLERRGARLLAGVAGLDHSITRVSIMRARSPAFDPLQGGELALISLSTLRAVHASDESLTLARFIQDLAGRGIAAIALVGVPNPPAPFPPREGEDTDSPLLVGEGLGVGSDDLALADALELPLLGLPAGASPAEIEREVNAVAAARRAMEGAAGERDTPREVYDALVRASLRGEDDAALGQRLAGLLGVAVALEDEHELRWCALPGDFPVARELLLSHLRRPSTRAQLRGLSAAAVLPAGASTPGAVAGPGRATAGTVRRATSAPLPIARGMIRVVAALPVRQPVTAFLSLIVASAVGSPPDAALSAGAGGPPLEALAEALAQVAPLFALALVRQHDLAGVERRLRVDTLDALLAGTYADEAQMRARAEQVGHDLGRPQAALVVELAGAATRAVGAGAAAEAGASAGASDGVAARTADALGSAFVGAWGRARGAEVVALLPLSDGGATAGLADLARESEGVLVRTLGPASGGWSAGLGQPARGAAEARRSYAEARDSARLGALVLGPGHVASVADLGIYRLLLRLREDGTLAEFCDQTLGPLIADIRSGDALIETLEVFFACNGNLSEAARRLSLHRNSLIYRLNRARELLGHDLEDPEARLALQLALKGRQVLGW